MFSHRAGVVTNRQQRAANKHPLAVGRRGGRKAVSKSEIRNPKFVFPIQVPGDRHTSDRSGIDIGIDVGPPLKALALQQLDLS